MKLSLALAVGAALSAAAHAPDSAYSRRHHALAHRAADPAPAPEPEPEANHVVHFNTTHLAKRSFNGRASWYDVGLGACGGHNVAGDLVVALNSAQYGGGYPGPQCFKKIEISFNGITVPATIVDECPGCPYGGLDMSKGLFQRFTPLGTGIFYMTWNFAGAGNSPPPPPPKPKPTSSHKPPPPPPSSTHHSTSSSQPPPPSSTSHPHSSTTHKTTTHTSTSTGAATTTAAPQQTGNLAQLEQAIFDLAALMVVAGAEN